MNLYQNLVQLNQAHCRLVGLEARLEAAHRYASVQREKLQQEINHAGALEQELQKTRTTIRAEESGIGALDEKIQQRRTRMQSVTDNKEYSALLVELDTFRKEKEGQEQLLLAKMSEADALEEKLTAARAEVQEQQTLSDHAEAELARRKDEVSEEIEQARADREAAAKKVSAEELAIFDRLAATHGDEAMAVLVEEDSRRMEYTCGGCYMHLPLEWVNRLMNMSELVTCPQCSRILYVEQGTHPLSAGKS